jgi:nitric oxide reductase NorQ protein
VLKDLKHSTKQRFVALDFDYPEPEAEATILMSESGIDKETATKLVKIAEKVRNLRTHGLEEGVSTRLLVYAGQLMEGGVEPITACEATICKPITDDLEMQRSILELVATQF